MYGSVRYLFMMTTELIHKSFAILKRLITYVLEGIITSLILRVKINDLLNFIDLLSVCAFFVKRPPTFYKS
jgi:hypothetical protein